MTRVICDECRREVEPSPYGIAPDGWFRVDKRGYDKLFGCAKDFCSEVCLEAFAARQAAFTATPTPAHTESDPAAIGVQ